MIDWVKLDRIEGLGRLPLMDLIYTRLVLQHNPPPVMERCLVQLLGRLNPGGVAIFQLPTHMPGYSFRPEEYLVALRAGSLKSMEMHMLPQRRVFELIQAAGCRVLEIFQDESAGPVYDSYTFIVQR